MEIFSLLTVRPSLVEEEKVGGRERVRQLQGRLLEKFLVPFTEKITKTLKKRNLPIFIIYAAGF